MTNVPTDSASPGTYVNLAAKHLVAKTPYNVIQTSNTKMWKLFELIGNHDFLAVQAEVQALGFWVAENGLRIREDSLL